MWSLADTRMTGNTWQAHTRALASRLVKGRLFGNGEGVFAGSIEDPERGCSASLCTNCYEPIAFRDVECIVCGYELIHHNGMPVLSEWGSLDSKGKISAMGIAYRIMVSDINLRGDWRSSKSPLNRLRG